MLKFWSLQNISGALCLKGDANTLINVFSNQFGVLGISNESTSTAFLRFLIKVFLA